MESSQLIEFLRSTDLFAGVTNAALTRIARDLEEVDIGANTLVFRKGDDADAVYIIVEGRLSLEADGIHLVTRGPSECVGEFALIDEGQRSASASAQTAVRLLKWERSRFQRALTDTPDVAGGIL